MRNTPSNGRGDSVCMLQQCTHPRLVRCEIPCIHGHTSATTCVLPASNTGMSNVGVRVVTFHTLHLHRSELDQGQLLADVNGHRGRGGFAAHASRALLGNATSPARSFGATLNSPRLSVGHDAALYGAVRSGVRTSCPAPRHKSGNGQLVSV